jgi:LTXXQ motif family protein
MFSSRKAKTAAAAAITICIASVAMAQGPQRGERGWGMWGNDGMGWGMGMGMRGPWRWGRSSDWMLDRVEGRLAFIKTELKITEAQTPAWNRLADAIRTAAEHHNERMKAFLGGQERSKTLPDRVDAQEQFINVRLQEIKLIKAGLRDLYAVLSEDQKKEADDIGIPMVGMGGPWS